MLPLIKELLSKRVNDNFWEVVEVTCRKKIGSGVELYVKRKVCKHVCDPTSYYQLWHL